MSRVKNYYQLLCLAEPELGTFTPNRVYEAMSTGIKFSITDDKGKKIPMRNDISSTSHVWDYFEDKLSPDLIYSNEIQIQTKAKAII